MKSALLLLLGPLAALASPILEQLEERQTTGQTVDALMKAKGKLYFGTCTDQGLLTRGKNADIIKEHFGQVTPENSLKWQSTENQKGTFTLTQADYLVDFATKNNKTIRGHTFVWHSQLAGWVSSIKDKAALTKAIEDHITTIMTKYKGKIRGWVG
jgi:endo-1,4-beta-xylanase